MPCLLPSYQHHSVDYDTPELGDLVSNRGDVEATLGRLVTSALSSINTYLPDDINYDGRSDDGALLREWMSDPTNVRALARRAHFDISPGNVGGTGLPDDDRRGYGDIAAEERLLGKWTSYLTDPAVASAMVDLALDDKFTYYPDDYATGNISDEYRVLTSLKDYLTDPTSAKAFITSIMDGIPTALPDDTAFSQGNDAATVLRKWLDADPDNARRVLIGFAMDDKLGYLSDDMSSNAALPGYESVDQILARYKNDPTTNTKASRAFAGDSASTVLSDDAVVGEELLQSLTSYLSDPTCLTRLAFLGGGPTIKSDDSKYLPGYESTSDLLSRYCQDPTTIQRAAAFGGSASAVPDDGNIGEAIKSVIGAWLSDPTNASRASGDYGASGVAIPSRSGSLYYGSGTNMKRELSAGDDKLTMLPDDKFYLPGYESPRDTLNRYSSDPTTFRAKAGGDGLETPKSSLYYGGSSNNSAAAYSAPSHATTIADSPTFVADDDDRGLNYMHAPSTQGVGNSSPASTAHADGGMDGHTFYPDCSNYGAFGDALRRKQRDGGHFYYGRHPRDDY